jgi:PAS domain S-box-containing protein
MHLSSASEILRPRRVRWLIAGTALIIAAILAANVFALAQLSRGAVNDAQTSLLRQSLPLSELVDRTFQAVDLVLGSVAEKISREASTKEDLQQFGNQPTNEFLREKVTELPQIDTIGILDAAGNRVNFSRGWPGAGADLSHREYFQELKKNPRTETFIGEPVQGLTSGHWSIVVARPVLSDKGEFLGVVYAGIVLKYFEDLFRTTSLGRGYAAALLREDGTVLARYPEMGEIGTVVSSPMLARLHGSQSGVSSAVSPIDHQARIAAAHRLVNFPLIVVVTQTQRAAFSVWRSMLTTALLISLIVIGMILAAAFLIARSWRQQDRLTAAHAKVAEASNSQALAEAEMIRQRDLATQSALFHAAVENMPQGLCMFDASQRLIVCNELYSQMYGLTRDQTKQGTTLKSILEARAAAGHSPKDAAAYIEQRLRWVRDGQPYYVEDELRDGRIIAVSNQLMPGGGWVAVHQEITERKRAEERQELLMSELDHRVKNVLARVAVVAKYTRQGSRSIDELIRALDGRIQSMADAHALLSQSHWRGVSLGDLVRRQLSPYTTKSNTIIDGPDITLSASATQAVAMVLQELVTNAVKYGSLSTPQGKVSVNWDRRQGADGAAMLAIAWREIGGPPISAPKQFSYGTNLIRNLIPHELGGKVDLTFAPEGLRCDIEIPLDARNNVG